MLVKTVADSGCGGPSICPPVGGAKEGSDVEGFDNGDDSDPKEVRKGSSK